MQINADLHAHSGYAGGVGKISLAKIDDMMVLKGIGVIGTGDCLHPGWLEYLRENLEEVETGIFSFEERETKFILQTEVILTSKVNQGRKSVHVLILFPSFDAVDNVCRILEDWDVKNTIGRPFVKCETEDDVSHKLYSLRDINSEIEVIPAHVLTPDGIYGSNRPITYLNEFFGEFTREISTIETGLSADPALLYLIPELQDKTWISNSDAHSHHLHRMGREFTTFDLRKMKYSHVIEAIRKNRVVRTAEFHPSEGRYFLTGHRGNRKGHNGAYCFYSPEYVPKNHKCPICSKPLTIGVLERAVVLNIAQSGEEEKDFKDVIESMKEEKRERERTPERKRNFVNMIPLAEIIAKGLGIKSVTAKKVLKVYKEIMGLVGSECDLWFMDDAMLEEVLKGIDERIHSVIVDVKQGKFGFNPPGFDGEYGNLVLGETVDVADLWEIHKSDLAVVAER
jgi:DNA helicase-2/ATP-dependent DNA helicase PcrA